MVDPTEFGGAAEGDNRAHRDLAGESEPEGIDVRGLVLEHYQSVYRYAFRLTGSVCDAEDLTQQTFLIAQRKLHQVAGTGEAGQVAVCGAAQLLFEDPSEAPPDRGG